MAAQIPSSIRTKADIGRFVQRANQLEKFKPAIAYWCRYQALNHILSKSLQNEDSESMAFATTLMDKVEQMKSQHIEDPAIVDESVARASVEQLSLETFERADNAMRANKASAQTGDTFQAAVTFFDLLQIWGPPSAEVVAKAKYAKFHALRILKAVKAGEDPNLSNPVPQPAPNLGDVALDPNDPEVQRINQAASHQPTVEDVSDDPDGMLNIHQSNAPLQVRPPSAPSGPRPASAGAPTGFSAPPPPAPPLDDITSSQAQPSADPSPLESTTSNPRKDSAGGGYFPELSSPSSLPPTAPAVPSAPPAISPSEAASRVFYQQPAPPSQPPQPLVPPPNQIPFTPPPGFVHQPPPRQNYFNSQTPQPSAPPPPVSSAVPPAQASSTGQYVTDDMAVADAQKHARWAISALSFEDVPTAVKELRIALQSLGAG